MASPLSGVWGPLCMGLPSSEPPLLQPCPHPPPPTPQLHVTLSPSTPPPKIVTEQRFKTVAAEEGGVGASERAGTKDGTG